MPIRYMARVEPTKHVMDLVAFAQDVIRLAQERGLKAPKRHRRRKRRRRKNAAQTPRAPRAKKAAGNSKGHPLAAATE